MDAFGAQPKVGVKNFHIQGAARLYADRKKHGVRGALSRAKMASVAAV